MATATQTEDASTEDSFPLRGILMVGKLVKWGPLVARDGTVYETLYKGELDVSLDGNQRLQSFTCQSTDEMGIESRPLAQVRQDQSLLGAEVAVHVKGRASNGPAGQTYINFDALSIQHVLG